MYPKRVGRALPVLGTVLAALILACWHRRGGTALDHWVTGHVAPATGSSALRWAHRATDPWYVLLAAWALALRHQLQGRRRRAAALVVPVLAALAVTELVLKPGVDARSLSGSWTFPSGNVTGGVALLTAVFWVEIRHRGSSRRLMAIAGLSAAVGLSCFSLVADRTHYLTDALGGACVGVGVPLAILGRRRTPERTQPDRDGHAPASGRLHR